MSNDDDLDGFETPRRGRPKKDDEAKLTEKLPLSFTKDEMRRMMITAANHEDGPMDVRDWAKMMLLETLNREQTE